jgi:hypothetical protein
MIFDLNSTSVVFEKYPFNNRTGFTDNTILIRVNRASLTR